MSEEEPSGEVVRGMNNTKGIPNSPIPLRRVTVPGTGPFDSLAKSARSLTIPDLDAKKGRKNRDPLWCPEQDLNLHDLAATSS
jgi:hypothetical protein